MSLFKFPNNLKKKIFWFWLKQLLQVAETAVAVKTLPELSTNQGEGRHDHQDTLTP